MKNKKHYTVELNYIRDGRTEIVEFVTEDIEWSIDQYQRNRDSFEWKIIK